MSTSAIASIARALWPALKRLLVRIGRWLLGKLRDLGLTLLIGYMRGKIHDFERRRGRARNERRRRWLTGRIRRWGAAVEWLEDRMLERKIVTAKHEHECVAIWEPLAKAIPMTSRFELEPRRKAA